MGNPPSPPPKQTREASPVPRPAVPLSPLSDPKDRIMSDAKYSVDFDMSIFAVDDDDEDANAPKAAAEDPSAIAPSGASSNLRRQPMRSRSYPLY